MTHPYGSSLEAMASEFSEFYDRGHTAGYQQAQREAEAAKRSFKAWCDTIATMGYGACFVLLGLWLGSPASQPGETVQTADQMTVRAR